MEHIYVGDLVPSIASYKRAIEKYDKGIKITNLKKINNFLETFLIDLD